MRRNWWETIKERQAALREKNGAPKEPTKRRPYQWGAKQYLADFKVGEVRVYDERFPWRSLQAIASRMASRYGVRFVFNTADGLRIITRIR